MVSLRTHRTYDSRAQTADKHFQAHHGAHGTLTRQSEAPVLKDDARRVRALHLSIAAAADKI